MSETPAPTETPQLLLDHHLKALRLPTMLREYPGPLATVSVAGVGVRPRGAAVRN